MHQSYTKGRGPGRHFWVGLGALLLSAWVLAVSAAEPQPALTYRIQPGDTLLVAVWKESDLQGEVLVRPDGGLSFPLVGEVDAAGRTVGELAVMLKERLRGFIPNPVVSVAVKAISGNRVYVIGKVNRPGEFPLQRPIDVMQALALAGGPTTFASVDDIIILRRAAADQVAVPFRYSQVERGRDLGQNVVLQSGDTVVVP